MLFCGLECESGVDRSAFSPRCSFFFLFCSIDVSCYVCSLRCSLPPFENINFWRILLVFFFLCLLFYLSIVIVWFMAWQPNRLCDTPMALYRWFFQVIAQGKYLSDIVSCFIEKFQHSNRRNSDLKKNKTNGSMCAEQHFNSVIFGLFSCW